MMAEPRVSSRGGAPQRGFQGVVPLGVPVGGGFQGVVPLGVPAGRSYS
jgi:hypothetical protein